MARRSRPPGFDMTYRPRETVFGPPLLVRLPSFLYLLGALAVWGLLYAGENSPPGTALFHYVVDEDQGRVMSIRTFAIVVTISALASVIRAGMRGVRIRPDGVEARDVTALWPKLKRYRWPQIEQIVLDGAAQVSLDLWDGSRAYLPDVSDRDGLTLALERVARARAIPVRGGRFDPDELDDESVDCA